MALYWAAGCGKTPTPVTTTPTSTANGFPFEYTQEVATSTPVPTATHTAPATQQTWHSPTPDWTATPRIEPTSTPVPTKTPTRQPRHRVIAFVSDWTGDDDIYLYRPATDELINLTQVAGNMEAPAQDRDPVFGPDGRSLTYRSNTNGSWVFYQIDLITGDRTPLSSRAAEFSSFLGRLSWSTLDQGNNTSYVYEVYHRGNLDLDLGTPAGAHHPLVQHPSGDYGPAWRPGADQIAFSSWRGEKKDVYLVDADGSHLTRLTDEPGDCEAPVWHPDGRRLIYVRQQEGDADLWELDVDTGVTRQVTTDPYPDQSPAYAPDGTLFWTRYAPGEPFEAHDPYRPGRWRLVTRSTHEPERPVPLPIADMDVYTPAAGYVPWPEGIFTPIVTPEPAPTPTTDGLSELVELDIQVAGNHPRLHADLAASYEAWRAEVLAQSGYDVLGQVSDMFRPLGHSTHPYGHLSWHRTGRAVDLSFEWHDPPDGPNRLLVVREDLGPQTYWRLYLHCREQDGTMGEPLTVAPWVFWFDLDRAQEPAAYAAGGKPGTVPEGYYIDLTRLAKRHGWHRIAAYEEEDFDWRWDSLGREFWHYQRTDGLTWWQAMSQLYPAETLEQYYGWTVCVDELGLDPSWVQAKGIPTPAP